MADEMGLIRRADKRVGGGGGGKVKRKRKEERGERRKLKLNRLGGVRSLSYTTIDSSSLPLLLFCFSLTR